MKKTKRAWNVNGWIVIAIIISILFVIWDLIDITSLSDLCTSSVITILLVASAFGSIYEINPDEQGIVTFCGKFIGTVNKSGLRAIFPLFRIDIEPAKVSSIDTLRIKAVDKNGLVVGLSGNYIVEVEDVYKAYFVNENVWGVAQVMGERALRNVISKVGYKDVFNNYGQVLRYFKMELEKLLFDLGLKVNYAQFSFEYDEETIRLNAMQNNAKDIIKWLYNICCW